jgi:mono/diheme cytochrome c family protein
MKFQRLFIAATILFFFACSTPNNQQASMAELPEAKSLVGYVELTDPLDMELVKEGTEIFTQKCAKCHTLDTVEFTVPAFAGVTNRRSPEWIMNMIINVDEMLKQDPVAADLLQRHKKVMPDPDLSVAETRSVLEFLRNNDLQQTGEKDLAAGK